MNRESQCTIPPQIAFLMAMGLIVLTASACSQWTRSRPAPLVLDLERLTESIVSPNPAEVDKLFKRLEGVQRTDDDWAVSQLKCDSLKCTAVFSKDEMSCNTAGYLGKYEKYRSSSSLAHNAGIERPDALVVGPLASLEIGPKSQPSGCTAMFRLTRYAAPAVPRALGFRLVDYVGPQKIPKEVLKDFILASLSGKPVSLAMLSGNARPPHIELEWLATFSQTGSPRPKVQNQLIKGDWYRLHMRANYPDCLQLHDIIGWNRKDTIPGLSTPSGELEILEGGRRLIFTSDPLGTPCVTRISTF